MEMLWDMQKLALVASLKGYMDFNAAQEFEREARKQVDKLVVPLVVDLDELEYISSAGLRGMLAITKKVAADGNEVRFCNIKGLVADTLRSRQARWTAWCTLRARRRGAPRRSAEREQETES